MRKKVKIFIISFFVIAICSLVVGILLTKQRKVKLEAIAATFRPFLSYKENSKTTFNLNSFKTKFLLLAYASSDCDHCDFMTEEITKHISDFKDCSVVLIVRGDTGSFRQFVIRHNLSQFMTIEVLNDKDYTFSELYNVNSLPQFFMYNRDGRKIFVIKGETNITNLLKPLQ